MDFENVAPTSSRNIVRVRWFESGITNGYRLGLDGQVDIVCIEETEGMMYYRDHLPKAGNRFIFQMRKLFT